MSAGAGDVTITEEALEARQAHEDYVAGFRDVIESQSPAFEAAAAGDQAKADRIMSRGIPPKAKAKLASARRFFEDHDYDLGISDLAS